MNLTDATEAKRKKRAVVNRQEIIDYFARNPRASADQLAEHFGIHKRTAQYHLRRIRSLGE